VWIGQFGIEAIGGLSVSEGAGGKEEVMMNDCRENLVTKAYSQAVRHFGESRLLRLRLNLAKL
jgi:hypothetical protein